jgi:mannose-6-phosphate isomerase-like protein (cupin superfamily)
MNRIVTGYGPDGAPAILFEGEPPMVDRTEKYVTSELWISAETPAPLAVAADTSLAGYELEPPGTGSRFRIVEIMPQQSSSEPAAAVAADDDASGVHRTDTLDYVVVLRGEVTLVVGERAVTLYPGDVVVQGGIEHDWENRGTEPCAVAAVLIAGAR